MLTPKQTAGLSVAFERLAEPIVEYILRDVARRVSEAGQLTSTAAYQIWRAQELGMSRDAIEQAVARILGKQIPEVQKLFTQAAEVGYNFDISHLSRDAVAFAANRSVQQITQAAVALAEEGLRNITQTLGFQTVDGSVHPLLEAYQQTTDYAFQLVISGAADYNTAIRQACGKLASGGVRYIDYASGVHTSLEAAIRRNMMGGLGLMVEQISQQNHDDLGADGWELSAHSNSAPDHEPFQGRQYTDAEYQALNNSLLRRIGMLNCGHNAFPIIIGVNEPQHSAAELRKFREDNEKGVTYEGRHYTGYEATQKQRQIERAIRAQKRRALISEVTGDADKLLTDQIKLQRYRQEYLRFSKAVGLRTENERLHVSGFGKGEAARAKAGTEKTKSVNIDITDGGKYKVLPFDNVSDYHSYIRPEYNAQRMTHADSSVLFAADGGYIQNADGYKDINGYMRGLKDHLDNPKCKNTMDVLIRRTSKPALKQAYVGYRKVNPSYLHDVLGLDTTDKLKSVGMPWESFKDKQSAQELADAVNRLVGTEKARVTDKAVTSVSLCEKLNFFKHRPVKFEIQMPSGTKGLITTNYPESEFIAKPNSTLEILGAKVYDDSGKSCITIFARMVQD